MVFIAVLRVRVKNSLASSEGVFHESDSMHSFSLFYLLSKNLENANLNSEQCVESCSFEIDSWESWPHLYFCIASCRVLLLYVIFSFQLLRMLLLCKIKKMPCSGSQSEITSKERILVSSL